MTSFIWHKSAGVMASPPRRMTVESFGERERKDTPIKNLPMTLILWFDGRRDRDVRYNTIIYWRGRECLIFTLDWSFCFAVGVRLLNVVLKVTRYLMKKIPYKIFFVKNNANLYKHIGRNCLTIWILYHKKESDFII